jgi:5-methylcytosine-specific restriction endonuclease McrA
MANRTCSLPGCGKPHRARGLCSGHYNASRYTSEQRHPRVERTCETCGVEYLTQRTDGRFCSLLCRDLWRLDQPGDPMWSRGARLCRLPLDHPAMWYGMVCALTESACRICGLLFMHRPGRPRVTCSSTCRNRARKRRQVGRKSIKRVAIFERDGYICWMCDMQCDPTVHVPHPDAPTVDHLVPQSLGGTHDPDNLATACFTCNSLRGASWTIPQRDALAA